MNKLDELKVKIATLEEQETYLHEDMLSVHLEIAQELRRLRELNKW